VCSSDLLNNDFFVVQRTRDLEMYDDIVKVKGAGTSTSTIDYSVVDSKPLPGKLYYRLKQSDFDGMISYSKLVSVEVDGSAAWLVYPNPSNGSEFNVGFAADDIGKTAYIKVQNLEGKEQFQLTTGPLNSTQMKVESPQRLSPGLYVISIAVEQQVVRQKLIVR
jgi:hypothetical protein